MKAIAPTWLSKYRLPPIMRTKIAIPKNVAPKGLPSCRRRCVVADCSGVRPSRSEIVAFSRKSWVIAIPIDANARDVRSHARNVRSVEGQLLVVKWW